jgi:hypothetical protein
MRVFSCMSINAGVRFSGGVICCDSSTRCNVKPCAYHKGFKNRRISNIFCHCSRTSLIRRERMRSQVALARAYVRVFVCVCMHLCMYLCENN